MAEKHRRTDDDGTRGRRRPTRRDDAGASRRAHGSDDGHVSQGHARADRDSVPRRDRNPRHMGDSSRQGSTSGERRRTSRTSDEPTRREARPAAASSSSRSASEPRHTRTSGSAHNASSGRNGTSRPRYSRQQAVAPQPGRAYRQQGSAGAYAHGSRSLGYTPRRRVNVAGVVAALVAVVLCVGVVGYGITRIAGRISGSSGDMGSASGGLPILTEQEAAPEIHEMDVLMIGDILMHQGVWESGMKDDGTYDYTHFFTHIQGDLDECDLCMLDQETILGGTELGISGYPIFNSPQQVGDSEVEVGFNCILMASNHTMDKGDEGVARAVQFWRENHPDVLLCGAVMPGEETAAELGPLYFEHDGIRVAVLNYTEMLNGIPDPSDCVCEIDEAQMQRDIAEAEANADITIVCPHWGDEGSNLPADRQRELAQKMCDWGVDVVFGNHPHVIQPVEVVTSDSGNEMVVYWSVGNFVSTQMEARNMIGGIARVHIVKEGDELAHVDTYTFTPTVTHRGFGTNMTCYRLSDYTDDMVADNWWHGTEEKPTPEWAVSYCEEVLGSAFDPNTCILEGRLYDGSADAGSGDADAADTDDGDSADADSKDDADDLDEAA